jgi:hypothetical protein
MDNSSEPAVMVKLKGDLDDITKAITAEKYEKNRRPPKPDDLAGMVFCVHSSL